jgi:hypothetical protein
MQTWRAVKARNVRELNEVLGAVAPGWSVQQVLPNTSEGESERNKGFVVLLSRAAERRRRQPSAPAAEVVVPRRRRPPAEEAVANGLVDLTEPGRQEPTSSRSR